LNKETGIFMQYVNDFSYEVKVIENEWIPMKDGTRIAARIWYPENAENDPVPAVLEYIPYRKRDITRKRDDAVQKYVAGHGYAVVRADIRGSGDSEGVLTDEYIQQEQEDGLEILQWIASQPWCNGNMGMIGISWGGFNGLQIAALQPPGLKAIITVCSTDDRYADDVHYMGGCLLGDNLSWASVMFALNSTPPDPEIVGEKWKDIWVKRLEGSGLWVDIWLQHQHRDEYWKHGSVCENYHTIQIPVMAVSGWADGYSNAVFRMMENLVAPRKGLLGPWSHKYPHEGVPGPAIGWLQECLRWWDHWLKEKANGIMDEPMLRAYMQESIPPFSNYTARPGRWVGEEAWPSPHIKQEVYHLTSRDLTQNQNDRNISDSSLTLESPLRTGLYSGKWCSYSAPPDLPGDQREDDGGALVFNTGVLENPLEIMGAPVAELEIEVDQPMAMIAVRLSDVLTNGDVRRVTYGLLNLTHRNSHEHPEPLVPGKRYKIRVKMNYVAENFPAGNQIRLAISSVYWPLAWPSPKQAEITLHTANSKLILPVRAPRAEDKYLRPFDKPETATPPEITQLIPEVHQWKVERDLATDETNLIVVKDDGRYKIQDINLEMESSTEEKYTVFGNDSLSLKGETFLHYEFKRDGWNIRTVTHTELTSDEQYFYINADVDAYEGDVRIFCNSWNRKVLRNLV
jgi:uncharacterized protein